MENKNKIIIAVGAVLGVALLLSIGYKMGNRGANLPGTGNSDEIASSTLESLQQVKPSESGVTVKEGLPIVKTLSPQTINQTDAVLSGEVNPNGFLAYFWFEWGTTASLGKVTSPVSLGSGKDGRVVLTSVYNLASDTNYYYRVIASNGKDVLAGQTISFKTGGQPKPQVTIPKSTIPTAETTKATNVTKTSAMLRGQVNSNGVPTTYWFEYGTTPSFGSSTSGQSTDSDYSNSAVSTLINALASGNTYYFRLVAQNIYGTSHGSVMSFKVR